MRYIHSVQGSFFAFVIFVIVVIFIPGNGPSEEVKIILTVSTFLLAILSGFFISRLSSRYNEIRSLVASEDGYWLALYKVAELNGKKFTDKIRKKIDQYYVACYDFDVPYAYKSSAPIFLSVYDDLKKIKNTKKFKGYSSMIDYLLKIEERRNQTSVLGIEKLTKGQWGVLFLLIGIVLFSLFYLKTDALYSQVVTVLLSTVLILILLILRDLQNLRLSGAAILEESGQEVLDAIGCLRYYNHIYVDDTVIPKHIKKYRLGKHKPGEKPKIVIMYNKK
jgi:hypothetical protein